MKKEYSIYLLILIFFGCSDSPKVIESDSSSKVSTSNKTSTGIFDNSSSTKNIELPKGKNGEKEAMHTVKILETLPTSKYVYLRVNENNEEFWIATIKQDVKIGETYYYKGGLLKTNFESKEFNRTFDKIYLVSRIMAANHSQQNSNISKIDKSVKPHNTTQKSRNAKSILLSEIIKDPKKYSGKKVQVSGKCVKINPNIMGRNWIHLDDGTNGDFDFVVTSKMQIQEGSPVTLTGTITLDKDFGAGYRYDLIMEDGVIIP